MFNESDIIAKAWMTVEVCNLVLANDKLEVDKIYLIGSYANGNPNSRSDIDYLVQLKGGTRLGQYYPRWDQIQEIHNKLGTRRVHVILGRREVQESLHQKNKNKYKYREIAQGVTHAAGKA